MSNTKGKCADCGPSPTAHWVSWWQGVINWLMTPYLRLVESVYDRIKPRLMKLPWDKIVFKGIFWLEKLKVGKVITDLKNDHSLRTRAIWEEAKRRGIEMFEFRPFGQTWEILVARYKNVPYVFDGLPRPRGYNTDGLKWMDDKIKMRNKFKAEGIPVARGGEAVLVKKALQFFDEIGPPLIVKPRFGSRSRHTFIHINTRSQLVKAFYSAQKLSPWVVIEEQLEGPVHRATVIDGKLIGVARRDLPHVVGDGHKTLAELVAEVNNHPGRQNSDIYTRLPDETEAREELVRQELTWQSVPAAGQVITLAQKVNRGMGGVTVEVTSEVHPDNWQLFEKVARVVCDPIIGIDFIVRTVKDPWHSQAPCGVIECNSLPFIDLHHYPISGEPRNAAGAVWDLVWHQEHGFRPKVAPAAKV